jgi:hypothetical protein
LSIVTYIFNAARPAPRCNLEGPVDPFGAAGIVGFRRFFSHGVAHFHLGVASSRAISTNAQRSDFATIR